jgi:hypothetical protein
MGYGCVGNFCFLLRTPTIMTQAPKMRSGPQYKICAIVANENKTLCMVVATHRLRVQHLSNGVKYACDTPIHHRRSRSQTPHPSTPPLCLKKKSTPPLHRSLFSLPFSPTSSPRDTSPIGHEHSEWIFCTPPRRESSGR